MLLVGTANGVFAQDEEMGQGQNTATDFKNGSVSQVTLFPTSRAASTVPIPSPAGLPAAPAAQPKYVYFGDRDDYRWQSGLGVEFFRFRSNVTNASMVGRNDSDKASA
jgi:hypothetical protein